MAKNKKVVIVDEELTPTVLKTIKEKKGSVIWPIIIFAILVAAVIYLPDISVYLEEYLNPTTSTPNTPVDNGDDSDTDEEDGEEVVKYNLTPELQITDNNIALSNFAISNNQLTFSITNSGTEILDFSQLNYFLELYNSNIMLVQRIMISDVSVASGRTTSVTYDLTDTNISSISFEQITEDGYPSHILTTDENGNATLTCIKNYETVNYLLTNNQVYAIEDTFVVSATDENYSTLYSSYQALAATYNTIGGISSTVNVANNILTFRTDINLSTVSEGSFNNIIYYPKDTDAKVMNFELEANGYTCN